MLAALAAVPLAFLTVFFIWPVATLVGRGFTEGGALDLSGFAEIMGKARTWRLIGRTVAQATLATLICALAAVPIASLLWRRSFRGRGALRALLTVPFALPSVVVGLAFKALLGESGPLGFLGLDQSLAGVVASLVFFNVGLLARVVGTFWAGLDPRPEQAARVLGAGPWRALATVTLPALAPALAAGGALGFLFCATAFAPVLILGGAAYSTVETEIYLQTAQLLNLRAAAVLSVAQLLVVAGALWFGAVARRGRERSLAQARAGGADRAGGAALAPRLDWRADWPSVLAAAAAAGLIALPLGNLIRLSLRTSGGLGLDHYTALADPDIAGLGGSMLEAAGRSVVIALAAGGLALALGLAVAVVASRPLRSRLARRAIGLFDAALMAPLGVSAVTVGFGFLITLNRPPLDLRTSFWLIPLAQALVALPLVVRSVLPALRALPDRARQAAAVLGAPPWRVFWTVDGPVLRRGAAVA
ncbi:MAG: ABC transporter permease subunit, partial [Bifidobacteriaceae bacterium]|nr:ABC transporter permease subunit [Bifidobacteriaceae bacterium]